MNEHSDIPVRRNLPVPEPPVALSSWSWCEIAALTIAGSVLVGLALYGLL